jgi:hypothetical protein
VSVLTKSVPITTAADGSDVTTVRAGGILLHAVRVELGTLDTPDITIKEQPANTTILAVTGVAADGTYYPSILEQTSAGSNITGAGVPVPVYDRLEVTIAGGGDTKTGRLILLYER